MKHLVWGIVGATLGFFLLLGDVLLSRPSLSTGFYGVLFLVYGIYRLNKFRTGFKGDTPEYAEDPLQKQDIY